MKPHVTHALFCLLSVAPCIAFAQGDNGRALLGVCQAWEKWHDREWQDGVAKSGNGARMSEAMSIAEGARQCRSYIENQKWKIKAEQMQLRNPLVCIPELAPPDADVMVVLDYLKKNRTQLELSASALVQQAFQTAYPCTPAKKKPEELGTKSVPL